MFYHHHRLFFILLLLHKIPCHIKFLPLNSDVLKLWNHSCRWSLKNMCSLFDKVKWGWCVIIIRQTFRLSRFYQSLWSESMIPSCSCSLGGVFVVHWAGSSPAEHLSQVRHTHLPMPFYTGRPLSIALIIRWQQLVSSGQYILQKSVPLSASKEHNGIQHGTYNIFFKHTNIYKIYK